VASSRPSGLNATAQTSLVWPVRVRRHSPGGRAPQPRLLILTAGGEQAPVRAERHSHDLAVVDVAPGGTVGQAPHPRRLVGAGGGEQAGAGVRFWKYAIPV
jgi:hypothetical protein